ncbi:hypothetical protein OESDEN_18155 [Oesophagostomum dentatum]|uniref:Uncharacterized protein n=1 Tax=Oesophagostomum dentatum TaxID=61180 RepID=A0A0B1SA60_OESDE|nr:hypothetical protein OESDEN_18155 [Oesophagostomum dentatum]
MIDLAWLCAFAIRCVYWLVLLACNFLGYSTLWAHREIKQRGQRLDARFCAVPAHVAIINNGTAINKETLLSLLEVALVENIRRLTIYDPSRNYARLAQEIKGFCRTRHIRIIVGCATNFDDISTDRLCVQLLSANSGRSALVEACRELSSSNNPITPSEVTGHLAAKCSLLEPDLLIQFSFYVHPFSTS